jgi:hypothetical protein
MPFYWKPLVLDQSAQIRAQGMQDMFKTIGTAGSGAIADWKKTRQEQDMMQGGLAVFAKRYPDLLDADTMQKFQSGSIGTRRGIFTGLLAAAQGLEKERAATTAFGRQMQLNPPFGSKGGLQTVTGPSGEIVQYDPASGTRVGTFGAPPGTPTTATGPGGQQVLYDPNTNQPIATFRAAPGTPQTFQGPGGQQVLYDPTTNQPMAVFRPPTPATPRAPATRTIVNQETGLEELYQWDPQSERWVKAPIGPPGQPGAGVGRFFNAPPK